MAASYYAYICASNVFKKKANCSSFEYQIKVVFTLDNFSSTQNSKTLIIEPTFKVVIHNHEQ